MVDERKTAFPCYERPLYFGKFYFKRINFLDQAIDESYFFPPNVNLKDEYADFNPKGFLIVRSIYRSGKPGDMGTLYGETQEKIDEEFSRLEKRALELKKLKEGKR